MNAVPLTKRNSLNLVSTPWNLSMTLPRRQTASVISNKTNNRFASKFWIPFRRWTWGPWSCYMKCRNWSGIKICLNWAYSNMTLSIWFTSTKQSKSKLCSRKSTGSNIKRASRGLLIYLRRKQPKRTIIVVLLLKMLTGDIKQVLQLRVASWWKPMGRFRKRRFTSKSRKNYCNKYLRKIVVLTRRMIRILEVNLRLAVVKLKRRSSRRLSHR